MRIKLDELIWQQHNVGCWFDRKTYTVLHCDPPQDEQLPYCRYIPLYQVDWDRIYFDFFNDMNDRFVQKRFEDSKLSAYAFFERNGLERRWHEYYYETRKKLAIQWCIENNIKYEGE